MIQTFGTECICVLARNHNHTIYEYAYICTGVWAPFSDWAINDWFPNSDHFKKYPIILKMNTIFAKFKLLVNFMKCLNFNIALSQPKRKGKILLE